MWGAIETMETWKICWITFTKQTYCMRLIIKFITSCDNVIFLLCWCWDKFPLRHSCCILPHILSQTSLGHSFRIYFIFLLHHFAWQIWVPYESPLKALSTLWTWIKVISLGLWCCRIFYYKAHKVLISWKYLFIMLWESYMFFFFS